MEHIYLEATKSSRSFECPILIKLSKVHWHGLSSKKILYRLMVLIEFCCPVIQRCSKSIFFLNRFYHRCWTFDRPNILIWSTVISLIDCVVYYICFNCVLFEQCWFYNNARQFIICIDFQCACTYFRVLNFTLRKNDFYDDIHQINRFSLIYILYVTFNNKCLFCLSFHKSLIALDKIVKFNFKYNMRSI